MSPGYPARRDRGWPTPLPENFSMRIPGITFSFARCHHDQPAEQPNHGSRGYASGSSASHERIPASASRFWCPRQPARALYAEPAQMLVMRR